MDRRRYFTFLSMNREAGTFHTASSTSFMATLQSRQGTSTLFAAARDGNPWLPAL